jgi:DNA modification methylase
MKIEQLPTDTLIPYARNTRTHSEAQVAQIAGSIREFGFTNPVLIDGENGIIAGHGRVLAAQKLKLGTVPCIRLSHLTDTQRRAYIIADNKLALNAGWDEELLGLELADLREDGFDLELTGFDGDELADLLAETTEGQTDPDEVPEPPVDPVSVLGDVWVLGRHRLMCGDSTTPTHVEQLMKGERAQLLHADPPYGMGKEKDGVENDNLYADKLDAFQMEWWATFRPFIEENASAYIWGNAEDLWRLWYAGGLKDSERLTMRNEIVWDKPSGAGLKDGVCRCFGNNSERCLFFMLGEQGFNNNADNYWEGWEPIRKYLAEEMEKCGGSKKWKEALGNQMGGHYFTKSQWCFPTEEAYKKLQAFAKGDAFKREHDELKREHDELKREHDELKRAFYDTRAHFDNTHDNMTDVWEFGRVTGSDRHSHATPKPVEMMERIIKSSASNGALCVEPFNGSGSTLMAAEKTGRRCNAMELTPAYIDVTVKRWQAFTGKQAIHEASGKTFDELKAEKP